MASIYLRQKLLDDKIGRVDDLPRWQHNEVNYQQQVDNYDQFVVAYHLPTTTTTTTTTTFSNKLIGWNETLCKLITKQSQSTYYISSDVSANFRRSASRQPKHYLFIYCREVTRNILGRLPLFCDYFRQLTKQQRLIESFSAPEIVLYKSTAQFIHLIALVFIYTLYVYSSRRQNTAKSDINRIRINNV